MLFPPNFCRFLLSRAAPALVMSREIRSQLPLEFF